MNTRFDIPQDAAWIIQQLNQAGYQAYVVGGCVRDMLLGKTPKDWDICTSAKPEEMQRVFSECHVVETGLQHGTLTVVLHHVPYEVTTFRVDGAYTDHRHPDSVSFVTDVREDLARRDFTVNAMAYHPENGLVDAFGGREDLAAKIIRCVGEPQKRFEEDALRILRALRFASTYGFAIEEGTSAAIHAMYTSLEKIAGERVRVELAKLLCGAGAGTILRAYTDVFTFVMPETLPGVGFDQKTPYHRYTVWEHCVQAVENILPEEVLRLTMLLHDCGKPYCFTVDENGIGHSYGHQKKSAELAAGILERLRMDNATRDRILMLIQYHDISMSSDRKILRRRLNQFGEEGLRQLILVQIADNLSKGTMTEESVQNEYAEIKEALTALLTENPCVTIKSLAVNGNDLMQIGCEKGKMVGDCLKYLLDCVLDEKTKNDREDLLEAASAWISANK